MCGIVGVFNLKGNSVYSSLIKTMTKQIAHRGPDSVGYYVKNNIGLGHRRLSIIDLSSAGAQPMTTKDGRYTIVFNGEIYNFKKLNSELTQLGAVFKTNSDTETIL